VHDVYYQETLVSPRTAADCIEAAGTVLLEIGSRPVVESWRVSADLGSILATRAFVGLFCPLSWLPVVVTVDVREVDIREAPGQRALVIGVGDRLPFQGIYLGRGRYKKRCQQVALLVRNEIDAQLGSIDQR
jgi:hypothetical protein